MAGMINISKKALVQRRACATGELILKEKTIENIKKGRIKKGDVLASSQVAGILAVKNTSSLLPLCHQVPLTGIDIKFSLRKDRIIVTCEIHAEYKTGVEMEALVGVVTALLNIWDMVKYLEKDEKGQYPTTCISNILVKWKRIGNR